MNWLLALLGNAFLVAFALDAGLTLVDEVFRTFLGAPLLGPARNAVAQLPLAAAPAVAVLLPLAPGLPARVFLPPLVFLAWTLLGALPLPIWLEPRSAGLALGAIQVGFAAAAFVSLRQLSPDGGWLLKRDGVARARFRPGRALLLLASAAAGAPLLLGAYGVLALALGVEHATGGFMHFDLGGISSSERVYVRGEQQVRLVGLMHLGEGAAYRELFASFDPDALVLAEGVTDHEGRLADGLPYEAIAGPLGLDVQPPIDDALAKIDEEAGSEPSKTPRIVRADVDTADFSDETLEFLRESARTMTSPDLATGLARARELGLRFDAAAGDRVLHDILTLRNAHLIEELDSALAERDRIIVPWGALHLPEIERALVARGFERADERRRPLVRYGTLVGALAGALGRAALPAHGGTGR